MSGCYLNALKYIFDKDGHTKQVCIAERNDKSGYIGRDMCPHFNGNCPALGKWIDDWNCYWKNIYEPVGQAGEP